jgi:hypothetical protein
MDDEGLRRADRRSGLDRRFGVEIRSTEEQWRADECRSNENWRGDRRDMRLPFADDVVSQLQEPNSVHKKLDYLIRAVSHLAVAVDSVERRLRRIQQNMSKSF